MFFETDDVDICKGHIRSIIGREYFLSAKNKGKFSAKISLNSSFEMNFGEVTYENGIFIKKNKSINDLTVLLPKLGLLKFRVGSRVIDSTVGSPLILCGDKCDDMTFEDFTTHRFFVVAMSELRKIMESMFERTVPQDLSIIANFDPASRFGTMLTGIIAAVEHAAQSETTVGLMSGTSRSLREAAIMAIIEGIPHQLSHWLDARPSAPASWQIRQAIDIIYARVDDSLTVQDLADKIGIGIRALQLGFRRHKQTSPHAFMKRAALEAARRQLRDGGFTIGEVARRWGFANSGRFAAEYRALFKEDPSQTKRQT